MKRTAEDSMENDFLFATLLLNKALAAGTERLTVTENAEAMAFRTITDLLKDLSNLISEHSKLPFGDPDFEKEVLSESSLQEMLCQLLLRLREILDLFRQPNTCFPLASQYFFLKGVMELMRRHCIAAPIMRGYDRKVEFNSLMTQVLSMFHALKDYGPVQAAIAWAGQMDREGLMRHGGVVAPDEALKTAVGDEIVRRRVEEIEGSIKILDEEIAFLRNQLKSIDYLQWRQEVSAEYTGLSIGFRNDYGEPFDWILPQVWLWWWWEKRNRKKHNRPIESRLAQVRSERRKLEEERRRLLREA